MLLVILLIALLAFTPVAWAAEPAGPALKKSTPITAGAVLKEYRWTTSDGPANIYVVQVDLNNPYVQLGVIPGAGKLTQRLNVSAMSKNTGAVAAVNADFYNTQAEGSPIGPTVINQQWVTSPSKLEGIYALGLTTDRQAYIEAFTFEGRVTAPNGAVFELSGLNKTIYWEEPGSMHSHAGKLHLYNDMWGGKTRGDDSYTIPTEMLVDKGQVISIVSGQYIDGPVPAGMQILRGHGAAARFLLDNFKPGDPVEITYTNHPDRNWSMVVGGHALLVDQGAVVPYTKDISALGGVRARTAAGISRDGKTIWLVGVEGRTAASKGLTLPNLSRFMVEIGVWRALNLDGGGSATMVARPLGAWETQRVFTPEQQNERLVVNALGIYTNAPKGSLKGLALQVGDLLLVNEQVPLTLKAYDEYYNPVDPGGLPVEWEVRYSTGTVIGGVFKALSPGMVDIAARAGSVAAAVTAKIVGKQDVAEMKLTAASGQVVKGEQVPLQLNLTTLSGKTRQVPASLVDWQFYGLDGQVSPQGTLTILDSEGPGPGFVVARYQGFSAPLPLNAGEDKVLPANNSLQDLTFKSQPAEVRGQVSTVESPPGGSPGPAARLDYDFTEVQGTAAAYVNLGAAGLLIQERPLSLMLDVYGDNGNQWLRAEVVDAAGNLHRLDLSSTVNWSGWRTLQFALTDPTLAFPITLQRLYVVSLEGGQQGTRAPKGTLFFKDLRLKYAGAQPAAQATTDLSMELTVGQKQMLVNGSPQEMDVAPVIMDGRTLVPVRFISQAMDASMLWDSDTKNVTVVQGRHWIDMWLSDNLMVVDGKAVALDVPPVILHGRTMLPLGAVARALGLTVDWDPETKKIMLN